MGDPGPAVRRVLAVPADTRPLAGSADVEVLAEFPGGPLSLRCRFGVWLDAGLFDPALRSGSLTPDVVAEALQHFRRLESGDLEASPLAEEVDADPEYVDWLREVPERARDLATAARPVLVHSSPATSWMPAYRLAAVFALLAVGLVHGQRKTEPALDKITPSTSTRGWVLTDAVGRGGCWAAGA